MEEVDWHRDRVMCWPIFSLSPREYNKCQQTGRNLFGGGTRKGKITHYRRKIPTSALNYFALLFNTLSNVVLTL